MIRCYASPGTRIALGMEPRPIPGIIGSWQVLTFPTQHDAAGPIGFLLDSLRTGERLMYATDTAYISNRFRGLTHIMVEANYSLDLLRESVTSGNVPRTVKRRIMENHFSLPNVIQMLKSNDLSKVQSIFLLHLSQSNGDSVAFKRQVQEATGKPVYIGGEDAS